MIIQRYICSTCKCKFITTFPITIVYDKAKCNHCLKGNTEEEIKKILEKFR